MAYLSRKLTSILITNKNNFWKFASASTQQTSKTTAEQIINNKSVDKSESLKLTESCLRKVNEICKDDKSSFLRIIVDGGGCSGFQYKFEVDNKLTDDDIQLGQDKRVVVDNVSLDYCAGATLDYSVELIKSGFKITSNPKAEQGCSCGASFALKMD